MCSSDDTSASLIPIMNRRSTERSTRGSSNQLHSHEGTICLVRWSASLLRSRAWRSALIDPIDPRIRVRGSTAKNPKRITESAKSPVPGKSDSPRKMTSSKSGTARPICVLIPHRRTSLKGGSSRRKSTGRFFNLPSAWGREARRTSPSLIRCTPDFALSQGREDNRVPCRHKLAPALQRTTATTPCAQLLRHRLRRRRRSPVRLERLVWVPQAPDE